MMWTNDYLGIVRLNIEVSFISLPLRRPIVSHGFLVQIDHMWLVLLVAFACTLRVRWLVSSRAIKVVVILKICTYYGWRRDTKEFIKFLPPRVVHLCDRNKLCTLAWYYCYKILSAENIVDNVFYLLHFVGSFSQIASWSKSYEPHAYCLRQIWNLWVGNDLNHDLLLGSMTTFCYS